MVQQNLNSEWLLNHSSESLTLTYFGLDPASRENMTDQIDFG